MRLFKVKNLYDYDTTNQVEALVPTGENFDDVQKFVRHATKNGEKYAGTTWRLVAKKGEDVDVKIEQVVGYKATIVEKPKAVQQDLFKESA